MPFMTPGDDSFQNEMIRAAGGIPPRLGKKGPVVLITKEEGLKFNPQAIYECGGDRALTRKLLTKPGWKDVAAVGTVRIFPLPANSLVGQAPGYVFLSCSFQQTKKPMQIFSTLEGQRVLISIESSRDLKQWPGA